MNRGFIKRQVEKLEEMNREITAILDAIHYELLEPWEREEPPKMTCLYCGEREITEDGILCSRCRIEINESLLSMVYDKEPQK